MNLQPISKEEIAIQREIALSLVRVLSIKYGNGSESEHEDLVQETMIHILTNPAKKSLKGLTQSVINSKLLNLRRDERTHNEKKKEIKNSMTPPNKWNQDIYVGYSEPIGAAQLQVQETLSSFRNLITEKENNILNLLIRGEKREDIAELLNLPLGTVLPAAWKIKKKFKKHLEKERNENKFSHYERNRQHSASK